MNDWIKTDGHFPSNIGLKTLIDVLYRGADRTDLYPNGLQAHLYDWEWEGTFSDIIAYRLHEPTDF